VAKIVAIHGIAQQFKGERTSLSQWAPALLDGIGRTGESGTRRANELVDADITFAFFGHIFRPPGQTMAVGDPRWTVDDITEFEEELLYDWWQAAAEVEPAVIRPDDRTLTRTPQSVQMALRVLSNSKFFAGMSERAMIGSLVQVRKYFTEPGVRAAARQVLVDAVSEDTRVVVAHSLGSVVAYETLCAHPDWPVRALVTMGSPLGVRNLIFDRLDPKPAGPKGKLRGQWPGGVRCWTNVADKGDIVALVKDLRPQFDDRIVTCIVANGFKAHDVDRYLTAPETGKGILAGLVGDDETA
jgi:hypothetical protein